MLTGTFMFRNSERIFWEVDEVTKKWKFNNEVPLSAKYNKKIQTK